jgi:hypothetical protein
MTTTNIDPAALRVLSAQARTVAGYHRDWHRAQAACQADGAPPRDNAAAAQAFAHHCAGRKVLGDGVSAALAGVDLSARRAAFMARATELLMEAATPQAPSPSTPGTDYAGGAPMTAINIDPAALRVLRAQARTVAGYHRDWRRAQAACAADGAPLGESGGAAQAFAHHSAGRKVLGDGVSAALAGVDLGARRAAFMAWATEQLLTEAATTPQAPSPSTPGTDSAGRAPMTTINIDPAAVRVLRAQARTVAGYHRGWRRAQAACAADGAPLRENAAAAQAFAHHCAGRKVLGDGVSAALVGVDLGARRAHECAGEAFMAQVAALAQQLLRETAATLPAPQPYRSLCCWCGRARTAHVPAPVAREGDDPPLRPGDPARLWHDRCWSDRLAERDPTAARTSSGS